MASLLPGYEYDIFISYRQKDNRSDQWVTTFVQALREELDATFKENVSIYFDANPHDGLNETHDVDSSLKEKIKCLIFIPIVSQTYCDPSAFAWQKELLPFVDFAKNDPFGLDIKLANGNVAKRVLPVRIHEIDQEDQTLFEETIGGVMRPVDFIYKESGVNRPLNANEENPTANLNQIFYKNQVNKVANAIKEIIQGLKKNSKPTLEKIVTGEAEPASNTKKYIALSALSIIVLAIAAYFFYPKFISTPEQVELDKSIAVLPFVNMSGDKEQEYFSDGISEELINALAKLPDMKVSGRTSSFSYKGKNENLQLIGKELGVSHILEGSVRKSGNTLRITAQLINANNGFHMWTETYDRELEDVFKIQDEITEAITKQLKIRLENNQQQIVKVQETNLGAYEIYMKARQELALRAEHLYEAQKLFERVIELDPEYSLAYSGLGITLSLVPAYFPVVSGDYMKPAKVAAEKAIRLNPNNAEGYSAMGCIAAFYEWNWKEADRNFQKSYELNPNDTEILNFIGDYYSFVGHPKAIQIETQAMELDPLHSVKHADVARSYFSRHLWQQGMEFGKKFNRLEPVILIAFEDFVYAHVALGHFEEAERLVNVYPKADEPVERAMLDFLRAIIEIRHGNMEKAKQFLPELEAANERGDFAVSKLARLYVMLRMQEVATSKYEKALEARDYYFLWDYYLFNDAEKSLMETILKSFNRPEQNELIEIRTKNLQLEPII